MGQLLSSKAVWEAGGTKTERPNFHRFMVLRINNTTREYFMTYLVAFKIFNRFRRFQRH